MLPAGLNQRQKLFLLGRRTALPEPGPAATSAGPPERPGRRPACCRSSPFQSFRSLRIWKATPRFRLKSATIFSRSSAGPARRSSGVQRRLEGGRRLQRVDLQGVERRQRLVGGVAPEQVRRPALRTASGGRRPACREYRPHIAAQLLAFPAHQTIAEPDQVIADVDGRARRRAAGAGSRARSGRRRRPRCRREPATPCGTSRSPGPCACTASGSSVRLRNSVPLPPVRAS